MQTMTEEKVWLSLQEAATHFGVSTQKIRSDIKRKNLETKTDELDRRKTLVRLSDLQTMYGRK
jgi:DeoR/GlpR family transcriptional regulator of sugar metabolism